MLHLPDRLIFRAERFEPLVTYVFLYNFVCVIVCVFFVHAAFVRIKLMMVIKASLYRSPQRISYSCCRRELQLR